MGVSEEAYETVRNIKILELEDWILKMKWIVENWKCLQVKKVDTFPHFFL